MKKFYIATMGTDFQKYVKANGTGIELDQFCMAENLEGSSFERTAAEIRKLMDETGLSGSDMVLHAPFSELYPAAIDPEALRLAEKRMAQAYDACRAFDINKMVVHSGYIPNVYFKSWQTERSVLFWTEFMKDKPEDFRLCIENVMDDEPYMMRDMMEGIRQRSGFSNIGICLDTGHANCVSDVDVTDWIEVLSPYISHFHIHNNDGAHDQHASFEQGTMDMDQVLETAQRLCSPDTTYTVEVMECGRAAEWLRAAGWL